MSLAQTPEPPYYAVIFSSLRTEGEQGYGAMSDEMDALAARQPGYLAHESARDKDGTGITVSYWSSLEAIAAWRKNAEHLGAQHLGRERWYRSFRVRVTKVERAYGFETRHPERFGDRGPALAGGHTDR